MDGELTVRQAEALTRKGQDKGASRRQTRPVQPPAVQNADTQALQQDLSEALGLAVEIVDRGGIGEIRLRYVTLEQLDIICQRLSGSKI